MNNRRITVVRPSQIFDSFMDEFFNTPIWNRNMEWSSIEVNVRELTDKVVVTAKMPGFTEDELNIHVEDNMLVIEGNKKDEKSEGNEEGDYYLKEYTSQNVKRSVSLPSKVDGEKAEAEIRNGILTVELPKQPEVMPKKISIKAA